MIWFWVGGIAALVALVAYNVGIAIVHEKRLRAEKDAQRLSFEELVIPCSNHSTFVADCDECSRIIYVDPEATAEHSERVGKLMLEFDLLTMEERDWIKRSLEEWEK